MDLAGSSERVFTGRLISVRVDTIPTDDGVVEREVVEHPGSVAVVALTPEGDVVMVRIWRHAAQAAMLEIPAGVIDRGESPLQTATRELLEETGFRCAAIQPAVVIAPTPGYSNEQITIVLGTKCVASEQPHRDRDVQDVVIMPPAAAIDELLQQNRAVDAKTLVGLLWLTSAARFTSS
jgi:ADP-ribose pyrophosphatase